jgi:hypothetical protein
MGKRTISIAAAASGIWLAFAASAALAQADCPPGSRQTLTGTMDEQPERTKDGKGWIYEFIVDDFGPCYVDYMIGSGPVPAQCAKGGRFTATGQIVTKSITIELRVTSIRCP